jgi:hypothetical protein
MFGKNSEFMAKAALIVEHINENASASVDNLSSKYNSTGSTYSAVSSKYNILG